MNDHEKKKLEALEAAFGTIPYKRLENENQSRVAGEKLRQSFIARGNPNPAAYGSVYFDKDGILVINVVDNDAQLKKEIAEALKGMKYYLRDVTYPWSYLKTIQDIIVAYMMAHRPEERFGHNLATAYASEDDNVVFVELQDPTDEAIAAFKKTVIDSPAITFKKSRGLVVPYASGIWCGDEVRLAPYPPYGYGSVGYRVYNSSYSLGLITAGHVFNSSGKSAYMGSDYLGSCLNFSLYGSGSNCDAAFVNITNANYVMENVVRFTSSPIQSLPGTLYSPFKYETVFKSGQATGYTEGEVI